MWSRHVDDEAGLKPGPTRLRLLWAIGPLRFVLVVDGTWVGFGTGRPVVGPPAS